MPLKPVIQTRDLTIGYRQRDGAKLLGKDLDLNLRPGMLTGLLGPNGVGKSTLLRTMAGLQKNLGGEIFIDDVPVSKLSTVERSRKLSVVLSGPGYSGHLRGYATVAMGRYPHSGWWGNLRPTDHQLIAEALDACGVADLSDRFLETLSDGERQKMMIARALAQNTPVMILDEPTAHLDLPNRVEIMQLLRKLCRDTGASILVSTHDLDLALQVADLIWLMPGDGQVLTGAPEDLALDGSLGKVFSRAGLKFDLTHGGFRLEPETQWAVRLHGQGEIWNWTRKALVRSGYQPASPDEAFKGPEIFVPETIDGGWEVKWGTNSRTANSLAKLLEELHEIQTKNPAK